MGGGKTLFFGLLGVALTLAAPARGLDISRWNGPDLGLGISRALVRYLLASPDAVVDQLWMYAIEGSRELDRGFVGFSSQDTVCVAAQRYRPGGVSAASLVDLLRRQSFSLVAADGRRALLAGEDGHSGQPSFFLVLSPDMGAHPPRGPLLVTLSVELWRALLEGEGADRVALEHTFGGLLVEPPFLNGESDDRAP